MVNEESIDELMIKILFFLVLNLVKMLCCIFLDYNGNFLLFFILNFGFGFYYNKFVSLINMKMCIIYLCS